MGMTLKDNGGGQDLFRSVYEKHAPLVRAVLYNICGGEHLDDLVQETFIKIWKGLPGFKENSGIKTWIYRIATNTALDWCRKNATAKAEYQLTDLPGGEGGEANAMYRDIVKKGLRRLSPEQRAVVTLCVFEELTTKDAANTLGLPEGTVKSRLHYARAEMGKFFQENGVTV